MKLFRKRIDPISLTVSRFIAKYPGHLAKLLGAKSMKANFLASQRRPRRAARRYISA